MAVYIYIYLRIPRNHLKLGQAQQLQNAAKSVLHSVMGPCTVAGTRGGAVGSDYLPVRVRQQGDAACVQNLALEHESIQVQNMQPSAGRVGNLTNTESPAVNSIFALIGFPFCTRINTIKNSTSQQQRTWNTVPNTVVSKSTVPCVKYRRF